MNTYSRRENIDNKTSEQQAEQEAPASFSSFKWSIMDLAVQTDCNVDLDDQDVNYSASVFNLAQLLAAHKTKGYDGCALILSTSLQYENPLSQQPRAQTDLADENLSQQAQEDVAGESSEIAILPQKGRYSSRNLQGVLDDGSKVRNYLLKHRFEDRKTGKIYQVKVKDTWIQRGTEGGREMRRAIEEFFECDHNVFILYYTGHGVKQTGNWAVRKEGRAISDLISLSNVLQLWEDRRKICRCCCCPHKCKCGRKYSKSSHLLIIADSCYSGAWVEALDAYHSQGKFKSVSMVASCQKDQESSDTQAGSTFTKFLVNEIMFTPTSQVPQYTHDIKEILTVCTQTSESSVWSLFKMICCPSCNYQNQHHHHTYQRYHKISQRRYPSPTFHISARNRLTAINTDQPISTMYNSI